MTKTIREIASQSGSGPFLIPVGVPRSQWLSVPQTDEELRALISTMILVWEVGEQQRSASRKIQREENPGEKR